MAATTYTDQAHDKGPIIESREDYVQGSGDDATPARGASKYWQDELKSSLYMLQDWHKQADLISKRFLDERAGKHDIQRGYGHAGGHSATAAFRLNLFYSNTTTLLYLLYGKLPKVEVSRRFNDANDDVGRVAALLLQRMLNNDVQEHEEEYDSVLRAVLEDRLVPGLGVARVRYDLRTSTTDVAAVIDSQTGQELAAASQRTVVESETTPADYFHWRDVAWSWGRTWAEMRWLGFRSYLNKKEFEKRFPGVPTDNLKWEQRKLVSPNESAVADLPEQNENWLRTEIWEIWDKESRNVFWVSMSHDTLLDERPDPLNLSKFFPTPPFLIANASTNLFIPTPDFHMAQDLYNEIDKLQTRIAVITEAVKVVGIYDASTPEIQRMLKEGTDNDLIPCERWAMFAEKGGLRGQIDWFPIEEVVNALINLRQLRDETIALLYQVTGLSDILRGQLEHQYEGVGQSEMKTTFASIRVQGVQEQFANFATDLMKIKAEIIARHFDAETIIEQSNAEALFDNANLIQAAVALIKNPRKAQLKIKIKAEAMAQMDYSRLQAERTEFLTALATFMQASAPLTEQEPATAPFLLRLLQWGLSGFRGADEIEGVVDDAIKASMQAQKQRAENPPPDPELLRLAAQKDLEQTKARAALALVEAKTKGAVVERQADYQADVRTHQAEHEMNLAQQAAELHREAALIEAKAQADMAVESHQSAVNAQQHQASVEGEMTKDVVAHHLELDKIAADNAAKIREQLVTAQIEELTREEPESDGET